MIKRESIDRLFDIAQIEEVVGDFVQLKRRGSNMLGLCPFHDEKTPSFTVSPSKGIFKCFGCGESGNSVGFVMKHEQLSYPDALRYLAKRYNFELEETEDSQEQKEAKSIRESLIAINNSAQKYYQDQLNNTDKGKQIGLSYFKSRGFHQKTIEEWGLGFAPEGFHNFLNYAKKEQFNEDLLLQSGLVSEKNANRFDFFRNRAMFPIHNHTGNVVAFAGRSFTSDKKQPKYINSAETEIYHKSQVLYGLYFAKKEIAKQDKVLLVEGYTDVISLHQSGVKNTVATSGTALTKQQIKLLKRYTNNITLLFDGDAAGLKAALRGVDLILPEEVNVRVVVLPDGQDPDSYIQEVGHSGFIDFIQENEKDFILFKLDWALAGKTNDPVQRAEATQVIVESIALIPNGIKRAFYVRECAQILGIDEQLLHFEVNKLRRKEQIQQKRISERERNQLNLLEKEQIVAPLQTDQEKLMQDKTYFMEKEVIRILLEYGNLEFENEHTVSHFVLFELEDLNFQNEIYESILEEYRKAEQKEEHVKVEDLIRHGKEEIQKEVIHLLNKPYELSPNWWKKHEIRVSPPKEETYKDEVNFTISSYKLYWAQQLLEKKMEDQKRAKDWDEEKQLIQEIQSLKLLIKENNDALDLNYFTQTKRN